MMTKVVQRFKLEYSGEPVGSVTNLVSIPDRPVNIKFTPRG